MEEIKISIVQQSVHPGQPEKNTTNIIKAIKKEKDSGAEIVVFPEMSIPGYLIGDKWLQNSFINTCLKLNKDIIKASQGITIVWGNVAIDTSKNNSDGSIRKYNAAYLASNGKLIGVTHKTHLPNYQEFHDQRHFTSLKKEADEENTTLDTFLKPYKINTSIGTKAVGLTLCEDLWWQDYGTNVAQRLKDNGAELIINLSCSPWHLGKHAERENIFKSIAKETQLPLIVCNSVGVQDLGKTVIAFDGKSAVYNQDGCAFLQANSFSAEVIKNHVTNKKKTLQNQEELFLALTFTLKTFLGRIGKKKVVIGLSGGIDSAVVAALCCQAVGSENVYAINISTKFNSEKTKQAAAKCAKSLGINFSKLDIEPLIEEQTALLNSVSFSNKRIDVSSFDLENIQSRARGATILTALAGTLNGVVICCGNKTELAFGYATLYGDLIGAIAPLGDLLKSETYQLARFINKEKEVIPKEIFDLPPSAELSAEQSVDDGKGDPFFYPYHDQLVRLFTEERNTPEDIYILYKKDLLEAQCKINPGSLKGKFPTEKDFKKDLEEKWSLFNRNVFKRFQSPPIIKVSKSCFGYDLHEAQI